MYARGRRKITIGDDGSELQLLGRLMGAAYKKENVSRVSFLSFFLSFFLSYYLLQ
jgi:hypothetical protein